MEQPSPSTVMPYTVGAEWIAHFIVLDSGQTRTLELKFTLFCAPTEAAF